MCAIMASKITEISMNDVPQLSEGLKYYDGEVAFADHIMTVPALMNTFKVNFLAFVFYNIRSLTIMSLINNILKIFIRQYFFPYFFK